ncbi:hypothetical protein QJQ58_25295 [Paenibacillus dendritiformis]|uniref:hypothetical protein n=1 Tax=Paenibacillus dendritiformis TaxID=130049 RepID=UPI00248C2EDA|nr:hypothetical protein [Paenibacillus dendritiformis]WGU93809.1 hypothetical protein QJQ58_25295 [Paenibacillus dendritiformis]
MQQFNEEIFKKRVKDRIIYGMSQTDEVLRHNNSRISELESKTNISDIHFFSHRKFFGKVIVFSKKLLRKLLMPILNKQTDFNHNVVQQFHHINELNMEQQQENVSKIIDSMTEELSEMHKSIEVLRLEIRQQKAEIDDDKKIIKELTEKVKNDIEVIDQLKKTLYETQRKSIFELYQQIGDMERVEGNYKLSYQMQLMALKYASDDDLQEQKVLESFKLVNQSRNAEYGAI